MRSLVRATPKTCAKCKYSMGFGSQPGKVQTEDLPNRNVACNYLEIKGHSRIFEDRQIAYDPKFCDKYDPGDRQIIRKFSTINPVVEWPLGYCPHQE